MPGRMVEIAFLGNTSQLESALERAGLKAEVEGKRVGDAFNAGTSKAAGGLSKLSALGASFGLPFTGALDNIGRKLDEAHTKTARLSTALQEAGKVTLIAGGAGFAAAAGEAVKLGEKFQTTTASIAANADISAQSAKKIGDAFLSTAGHSIFSAQQMGAAFASVAGQLKITEGHALGAGEALKVMTAAGDLAEATHQNLATATASLATVMQGYHLSINQAAGASDTLFNVSRALNVPVDQVAQALNRLHGRLGDLTPSLRDTSGLMVALGEHGITGSRGILVVNTALQTLVGGSKNTTALLGALGVHIYNSRGQFVGLQSAIGQLQPKFAQMTQQQQDLAAKTLFGSSAAHVMLGIIQQGPAAFNQAAQAAGKLGTAHNAAAQQGKTLHNEMETLKATVQDLGTKFGLWLIPKLEEVAKKTAEVIGWLGKHKIAAEVLAGIITGVLGLAVAVYATAKAKAFISATADMIGSLKKFAGFVDSTVTAVIAKFGAESAAADATAAQVGAANAAETASYEQLALTVDAEAANVGAASEGMAAAVEAADGQIIASNAAASASFADLAAAAGPLGVAGLAGAATGYGAYQTGGLPGFSLGALATAALPGVGELVPIIGALTGGGSGSAPLNTNPLHHALGTVGNALTGLATGIAHGGHSGHGSAPSAGGGGSGSGSGIPGLPVGGGGGGGGGSSSGSSRGGRSSGTAGSSASYNPTTFAIAALMALGIQPSPANVRDFTAWEAQEGGNWNNTAKFNPLNTTMPEPGYHTTGSQGNIGAYTSWTQGLAATVATLRHYPTILSALRGGASPGAFSGAVAGSPWGTGGINAAGVNLPASAIAALAQHMSGAGSTSSTSSVRSLLYANPFANARGLHQGRTDMGIDYTMAPGSPIGAVGAGRVVNEQSNWYNGQPYIAYQLTQGPNKGQVVYVAEQINPMVHTGQTVRAGQTIATYASHGTGIESGFGTPGWATLSQAHGTSGLKDSSGGTPEGRAFGTFLQHIGSGAYTTTNLATGQTSGGGTSIAQTIQQLLQQYLKTITDQGNTMLGKLRDVWQNGSVKTLENLFGVNTASPKTQRHLEGYLGTLAGTPGGPSTAQLDKLIPLLTHTAQGSQQQKQWSALISELKASHDKNLQKLASELVAAHKSALESLGQELYAEQMKKDAQALNLEATQLKDQTQIAATMAANVVRGMQDAAQAIKDAFSAQAQQIQDATQAMADSTSAKVQAIQDASQITTDTLGERGLYGLNLVAQKQQVGLDVMKQGFDTQIAQTQAAVDQAKTNTDNSSAAATAFLDAVQTKTNVAVGAAQANVDNVTKATDAAVQQAQNAVEQSATGTKAQQDAAQAQLERAQASQSVQVGQAQAALTAAQDAASSATQQAQTLVDQAGGQASVLIAQAQQTLQGVQDQAQVTEAQQQALIDKTKAEAQTQYAGSGLTVNITGVPTTDAAAIASEVGWAIRTKVPA